MLGLFNGDVLLPDATGCDSVTDCPLSSVVDGLFFEMLPSLSDFLITFKSMFSSTPSVLGRDNVVEPLEGNLTIKLFNRWNKQKSKYGKY